jgi:hypothetical protein
VGADPGAVERIYARRRPVSAADAERYLLSPDEGSRIFREEIVPDLLAGPEMQAMPTVVFLVGQHGAGKSRVAAMVAEVLSKRGGFADLDSDLYKPYHPQYDELMRRDDRLMAAYIGPDSWAWLAQANEYVRAHKLNAIKQETAQDFAGAAANMRAYRDAGYRIEAMVLGVPAAMSDLGIVSRYHAQVIDRGHGRLTVRANADRAYTGVLDLADIIDHERLAAEVGVFRRGEATPRYRNALDAAGQWQVTPALRAAIERERERTWTTAETADFQRTHAMLQQELGPRWTQRLAEILRQAEPLADWSLRQASTLAASKPDPQPSAGDDPHLGLQATAAASAREADRRRAHLMTTWQPEANSPPRHAERDTTAEAEPEAGC